MADAGRVSLATTALEDFWDTSLPVVFLAPWCLRYSRRHVWGPLGGKLAPDPWERSGALQEAEADAERRYETALVALATALEERSGERHTERYWRILLGPWLLFYVSAIYDRYARVHAALEAYPSLTSIALDLSCEIVPRDTFGSVLLLGEDAYNLQLCSRILRDLGGDVTSQSMRIELVPSPFGGTPRLARGLIDAAVRLDVSLHRGNVAVLKNAYFPDPVLPRLASMTSGRAVPAAASPALPSLAEDPASRASLVVPPIGDDDFGRRLARWIPRDIPTSLLEGHAVVRDQARRFGRPPRAVMSANAWYFDESFKLWAASAAERGTLLLGAQHGGNYGIDAHIASEDHETAITDIYYTWGWQRTGRHAQVRSMPATKLVGRSPIGPSSAQKDVLFVSTAFPRFDTQLQYSPEWFDAYLDRQGRFARALDARLARVLRLRPHRDDSGWDVAERWRDLRPEVAIETWDTPFEESLHGCRLFACDHLSTTFAEALALDKPSILFWDPDAYPTRGDALGLMDGLRRAGILFDTPEAAAAELAVAYDDVAQWWNRRDRQAAVSAFRERFARADPDSLGEWARELVGVLEERRA